MNYLDNDVILTLLRDLISIPSINPNFDASYNEINLAIYVRDWLQNNQVNATIEEVQPGRPNVYAEIGTGDHQVLCLCAHLDTVDVKEMTIDPFDPRVEGNKVYGRGSCDMKAGLAAVMCASAAFAKAKIPGKLILALVCDEEFASIGAEDFVKRHKADACILTEPSDLKMIICHKGFLWGKVTTSGKAAHGSRWDLGESAIAKMAKIVCHLEQYDREVLREQIDDLVGPASMHVSLINGGSGISTYAAGCTIHLERRTLPHENIEEVKSGISTVILGVDSDADIEWTLYRAPFNCEPSQKIVTCVQRSYQNIMGEPAEIAGWGIWTDAAIFQANGTATVNIGPIGYGLHGPIEWVDLDSVVKTSHILFDACVNYFSQGDC